MITALSVICAVVFVWQATLYFRNVRALRGARLWNERVVRLVREKRCPPDERYFVRVGWPGRLRTIPFDVDYQPGIGFPPRPVGVEAPPPPPPISSARRKRP